MKILLKKGFVGSVNNAQDPIKKLKHASQKKKKKKRKMQMHKHNTKNAIQTDT